MSKPTLQSARLYGSNDGPATIDDDENATLRARFKNSAGKNFAVHYEWDGTAESSISIWASCKPDPSVDSDDDWVEDGGVNFTNPTADSGKELLELTSSGATWYMIKVVTSAGTSDFSLWVSAKQ